MTLHQSQYFCRLGQPRPWLFFWVFPSVLIFIQTLEGCLFLEKGHTTADNGYIYNYVLFAHQGFVLIANNGQQTFVLIQTHRCLR